MARKKKEEVVAPVVETGTMEISPIKICSMIVKIEGDSDLILCKKARSYEREEIEKQSHPKGYKIPAEFQQPYNMWEKLITSIHWLKPIAYHDTDYSLYSEDEWNRYMAENSPCVLGKAFQESLKEAFISCGFKESTSKNGSDLKRTVSFQSMIPISFAQAGYSQHLAQTSGMSKVNVLTQQNYFTGWSAEVKINYLETAFPKETLIELIQCAGKFIGLGARRGEEYGRYHVVAVTDLAVA
ncbi:MAG: hypothetical protein IKN54_02370 [Lachnospiraceae bacterium]|nr:hypothetical protein [Lachnospiraceae bacterium]